MAEELSESERAQMKALAALQKVAWVIIRKWLAVLLVLFVTLAGAFSVYLVWRAARSVSRFDATTRLLYTPRTIAKLGVPSDKQVFSILDRGTLKRRVGTRLEMSDRERMCLSTDLQIRQERRPTNLFTLTAASGSWKGAVRKVNLYAEILVQAYVDYRRKDLESLTESFQKRQKDLHAKLSEIDDEVRAFTARTGEPAPAEALQALNTLLVEQRRELSTLGVQIANEEVKRRALEKETGGDGEAIVAVAPQIRQKAEEIAQLDAQLAKLREVYTDLNPKVIGKLEERAALRKAFERFLAEKGVRTVSIEALDRVEKAAADLAETALRLSVLRERRDSVQSEFSSNERKAGALAAILPRYERLRVRRAEIETSLREIDDRIGDIDYLKGAILSDLQQIERAGGAGDRRPLRPRQFLLAFVGAGIAVGTLLVWLLAYELLWGRVWSGAEIAAYADELTYLGSVPAKGRADAVALSEAMGVVALRLCSADMPQGVTLVCDLPGAEENEAFAAQVAWSASMSGLRVFRLRIVTGRNFEPPAGAVPMVGVHRKDACGWFPVSNRFALAPTEEQMLAADLAELRNDFDRIFVCIEGGVRHRGGSFLSQLQALSDAVLVLVGRGRTSRAWFAYLRAAIARAGKPAFALLTGVPVRAFRKELEANG